MDDLSTLDTISWAQVRERARAHAATLTGDEAIAQAEQALQSSGHRQRLWGTYLLGFAACDAAVALEKLQQLVVSDAHWEVQEGLAQAFDTRCAQVGYEAALPIIDAWLADAHPNARRAVSEGLRPWTAKARRYFAQHPEEAITRLAALRRDSSEYVRHSAGNALRDIRRRFPELVDAETARWNLDDPLERFTYQRVLAAR